MFEQILRLVLLRGRMVTHVSLWTNIGILLGYLFLLTIGVVCSVQGMYVINLAIFFLLLIFELAVIFNVTAILGTRLIGAVVGFMGVGPGDDISQSIARGSAEYGKLYWQKAFAFLMWTLLPFVFLFLFPLGHSIIAYFVLALAIMSYLVAHVFGIGDGKWAKRFIYLVALGGLLFYLFGWIVSGTVTPFIQTKVLSPNEVAVADVAKKIRAGIEKSDWKKIEELTASRDERIATLKLLREKAKSEQLGEDGDSLYDLSLAKERELKRLMDKYKTVLSDGYPKEDEYLLQDTRTGSSLHTQTPEKSGGASVPSAGQVTRASIALEEGIWQLRAGRVTASWTVTRQGNSYSLQNNMVPYISMKIEDAGNGTYTGLWRNNQDGNTLPVTIRTITSAKADGYMEENGGKSSFTMYMR